jgi:hypothetical protein
MKCCVAGLKPARDAANGFDCQAAADVPQRRHGNRAIILREIARRLQIGLDGTS